METIQTPSSPNKFWEGTSFWVALALSIFSLFTGFTTETGETVTEGVTQIYGLVFAIRKLVTTKIDIKAWISNGNTWIYLTALIAPFFGDWIVDVIPLVENLINTIFNGGNINSIITAAVSLIISIFYLRRDSGLKQIVEELTPNNI